MSDRDSGGATQVTVFAPGDERLAEEALRALAPRSMHRGSRSRAAMESAKVMMVDDESLNIEMTEAFLAEAGYQNFVSTDDSTMAMSLMKHHRPGVLLLDLSMPTIGGLDILAMMMADGELRHVPVIVLTSSIDAETKLKALSAGAMDFLSKPVDPSELALRIRNTLAATAYRDFLVHHDPLTGLVNKDRYLRTLAGVVDEARQMGSSGAILHVGVDRLGPVNDAFGRSLGDQVLKKLARRLEDCVQGEAGGGLCSPGHVPSVYRFEGDQFAIIVPQADDPGLLADFISKVVEESSFALVRAQQELFVTCSVGIAVFPQDAVEGDKLVHCANAALAQAKASGANSYEFYVPEADERMANRWTAGAALRRAFARDEAQLLYSPVVDLSTGRLAGAMAEVAWTTPDGQRLVGRHLTKLAAGAGMVAPMLHWQLEQMALHFRRWTAAGLTLVQVRIELSLDEVRLPEFLKTLQGAIDNGFPSDNLALHVSALPADGEAAAALLEALQGAGVAVGIAGFGDARTGIAVLAEPALREVGLAPELVMAHPTSRLGRLLAATVQMVEATGRPTIAAGVNDMHALAHATNAGVKFAHGAAYGAALPGTEFAASWLAQAMRRKGHT